MARGTPAQVNIEGHSCCGGGGVVSKTHHLEGDFDHGKIRKPVESQKFALRYSWKVVLRAICLGLFVRFHFKFPGFTR